MAGSLKDQLLQAGLADAKKAKQLEKEQRKQNKAARGSGVKFVSEEKQAALAAKQAKVEKDRELNRALQEKSQRKAINAQIKQLIENSKLEKGQGDIGFNFSDGKKVKKIYVNGLIQRQLSAGVLAIAKQGDSYELVPKVVAEKIAQRDEARVIFCSDAASEPLTEEEKDWYQDYEIPDDLMW